MPSKQTFRRQRCREVPRRIEQHVDDAIHMTFGCHETRSIHPKPSRQGRTNLSAVENFALDFAGLDDVFGQCLKRGVGAHLKAERLHSSQGGALLKAQRRKLVG